MVRGTTPTLTFGLPFEAASMSVLNIAFSQDRQLVLEKTLADCQLSGQEVIVKLTEEDTLKFDHGKVLEIQLRCVIEAERLASDIMRCEVGRILKDGVL